ncbi:Nucleoside:H symporter OS=Coraliomargarita akajimensis (strain DSM 45221 / IAM 15411 / JCM 23193 / KCTC 12865) GN=Caka_0543 PE=4 SV=1: Nuc_H_symport [Gemmata massiliana]|uniref:Major facilitator superfamily (MFS) profile domain-containing protein n=1 Tax=Gemmata massiliana TaxID=1210884 RepID=A0A6P2CV70_9BACT|nr:MFS transporter [Gemmata massiliana]VTR92276.1 Nucleoside:H symporter OS=Coraliomargarita akajimensis (strain DSM 45221 / IAM 15411 / JCM 23193 / KCTC 12865) GN=Caka_0543 PE=4 SV=1: Nuc_H_symport [Gemmata massiliana]
MLGSVPGRLAAMMFLQYFGVAALTVPLTRYLQTAADAGGLGFKPTHVGYIYMTFCIGAIVAPMVVGLLADRWFAVDRVIAAAHALMAALMGGAAVWCDTYDGAAANPEDVVWPLFVLVLGYAIGTQITLTLAVVISFRNLPDGSGSFWYVRLVGTVGWIFAGIVTGWVMNPVSPQPLYLSAVTSAVLAAFALALPHTPPKGHGRPIREVIGLPALKMFRDRSFVVFAGILLLCNMMNQFYGLFVSPYLKDLGVEVDLGAYGRLAPEVIMALAQVCEVGCMAATPWLLRRFAMKHLMLLGLAGLLLRNTLLYVANVPSVVAVALPMHGWGYAFYGLLGSYFVDREAPPHLRAGAQSLVTFLGSGPAVLVGNIMAGNVVQANRVENVTNWSAVWIVPLVGYAVALVVFAALFREPPSEPNEEE